jgi:hypothetical protein
MVDVVAFATHRAAEDGMMRAWGCTYMSGR